MCVVMLVEIVWRNGLEKKKPGHTFHGGFRPGHIYTHRPVLRLRLYNFVIGKWKIECSKNELKGNILEEIGGVGFVSQAAVSLPKVKWFI